MSVAQAADLLSYREAREWHALWDIDPWGEERADLRAALVAATISAAHGGSHRVQDFMPSFARRGEPTGDQWKAWCDGAHKQTQYPDRR